MSSRKFTEVKQNGENTSVVTVTSGIFVEKRYRCLAKKRFQFSVAMQNKFAVSNLSSCCNRWLRIMKAWNSSKSLFFRASTVSRLQSCLWSFLACLARFAQRTKKRETARSREQGIGGNAQPCKTGSYRSYPSWREGGWLLSLSYVNERSAVGKISTVLAFKSLSSVKRLIEKCIVYIYGRFIVTRFWTGTLSGLNCLTAWWGRRRSCDSFFTPLFSRRSEKCLGNASAIRGYKLRK